MTLRTMSLQDRILQAHDNIAYASLPKQTASGKWRNEQYFFCMECDQKARWVEKIKHLDTCATGALLAQEPKK